MSHTESESQSNPELNQHSNPESKSNSESESESNSESESESNSESESESGSRPFENNRVEVPGRAAVHDKRTPASEKPIDHYACPFCDFTDSTERVVRVHITSEDAGKHANRNAFLDHIHVQAVAADGTIVEDLEAPESTAFEGDFSTSFLPEGVDPESKQGEILELAIKHPTLSPADISERIYGDRDRAYPYTVLNTYLSESMRQARTGSKKEPSRNGWDDLREKQQRIIIAWLEDPDPDRPMADVDRAAEVSMGYSKTILTKYDYVVEHIQARLEAGSIDLDDLRNEHALPIDFSKPTPTEGEPASRETDGESESESASPTADRHADETIRVERALLRDFAMEMAALKRAAETDATIAPRDSPMKVAARKQTFVLERVDAFLAAVADGVDDIDIDIDAEDDGDGDAGDRQ